jgi:hypothetical protein
LALCIPPATFVAVTGRVLVGGRLLVAAGFRADPADHESFEAALSFSTARPDDSGRLTSRPPQNDPRDPGRAIPIVAVVAILRHDRHHPALAPSPEDEAFDFVLAGSIASVLAVFGAQIEAFEVSEAIIGHAGDLAGRRVTTVVMALPTPRLGYRAAVPACAGIAA